MPRMLVLLAFATLALLPIGCEFVPPNPFGYTFFADGFLTGIVSVGKMILALLVYWAALAALVGFIMAVTSQDKTDSNSGVFMTIFFFLVAIGLMQIIPYPTTSPPAPPPPPKVVTALDREKNELDSWRGKLNGITRKKTEITDFLQSRRAELESIGSEPKSDEAKAVGIQRETLQQQISTTEKLISGCDDILQNVEPLINAIRSSIEGEVVGIITPRDKLWEQLRAYQQKMDALSAGKLP